MRKTLKIMFFSLQYSAFQKIGNDQQNFSRDRIECAIAATASLFLSVRYG